MKRILCSFLFFVILSQTTGFAQDTQKPAVYDMNLEVQMDTALDSLLAAVVPEGDTQWLFAIETSTEHGQVKITDNKTGTFSYTPDPGYLGEDRFTYYLVAGTRETDRATVTLTIKETALPTESPDNSPQASPTPSPEATPEPVYLDLWNHWAAYSAEKLTALDKLHGETIGGICYFYPEEQLTRIRYIILANSVFDFYPGEAQELPFADLAGLPPWVLRPLQPAYQHGLLKGSLENGQLYVHPYDSLTRVEACMMIYQAIGIDAHNTDELPFADRDSIPLWAHQMVQDMVGYGLIEGYEDNTFRPYEQVTKAQAAQMLYQAYQLKSELSGKK